jgi:hypothetical protein
MPDKLKHKKDSWSTSETFEGFHVQLVKCNQIANALLKNINPSTVTKVKHAQRTGTLEIFHGQPVNHLKDSMFDL